MGLIDGLEYEDREAFCQTLAIAIPRLSDMQTRCLLLSLLGLTQKQTACILGIVQPTVSYHVKRALEIIAAEAAVFV